MYRPLGATDQIAVNLPAAGAAGDRDRLNRSRPSFDDHDRATFDLLRPLLVRAYRRALARERGQAPDEIRQAARSGQLEVLATQSGVAIETRPGID